MSAIGRVQGLSPRSNETSFASLAVSRKSSADWPAMKPSSHIWVIRLRRRFCAARCRPAVRKPLFPAWGEGLARLCQKACQQIGLVVVSLAALVGWICTNALHLLDERARRRQCCGVVTLCPQFHVPARLHVRPQRQQALERIEHGAGRVLQIGWKLFVGRASLGAKPFGRSGLGGQR
eukprot:7053054-Prymnesium_polylepis.1